MLQECQQEIESYKDQMREENNKMIAERKEHQEALKAMKSEIKSLNERSEKWAMLRPVLDTLVLKVTLLVRCQVYKWTIVLI